MTANHTPSTTDGSKTEQATPLPITSKHAGIAVSHPHFSPVIEDMAKLERENARLAAELNDAKEIIEGLHNVNGDRGSRIDSLEAQLFETRRQSDRFMENANNAIGVIAGLERVRDDLRRQLTTLQRRAEGAEKDRERIDWIQSREVTNIQIGMGVCVIVGAAYNFNADLRAAIDAARALSPRGPEGET